MGPLCDAERGRKKAKGYDKEECEGKCNGGKREKRGMQTKHRVFNFLFHDTVSSVCAR